MQSTVLSFLIIVYNSPDTFYYFGGNFHIRIMVSQAAEVVVRFDGREAPDHEVGDPNAPPASTVLHGPDLGLIRGDPSQNARHQPTGCGDGVQPVRPI